MRAWGWAAALAAALLPAMDGAASACGAYFGRRIEVASATAGARLYNKSTRMVVARDGDTSTITMTADYRGDPKEFAVVIAVPTVLKRDQIRTADAKLIDSIDAMTAPRLVETYDSDPCPSRDTALSRSKALGMPRAGAPVAAGNAAPQGHGVKVEAQYVVGEYDVAVLSAEQSGGLRQWLVEAGYNVPEAAMPVLATYIAEGLKFFVAKVNLAQQQEKGYGNLSPLQLTYHSPKFYVPLRLSTINAEGPQDMFVYALTRKGRVEAANFPTRTLDPRDGVPPLVAKDFDGFYKAAFDRLAGKGGAAVIERAAAVQTLNGRPGDINIAADRLGDLGATWAKAEPGQPRAAVMLTRVHMRYDRSFKNDLLLKVTDEAAPVDGRFQVRHPYEGNLKCPAGARYAVLLKERQRRERANLIRLTGWSPKVVEAKAR